MGKGILLDADGDMAVENGTFKVGSRTMQDAYLVLASRQGDFKEDPLAGVGLDRMIRGGENRDKIRKMVEIGLERVGVKFDEIKNSLEVIINKKDISKFNI